MELSDVKAFILNTPSLNALIGGKNDAAVAAAANAKGAGQLPRITVTLAELNAVIAPELKNLDVAERANILSAMNLANRGGVLDASVIPMIAASFKDGVILLVLDRLQDIDVSLAEQAFGVGMMLHFDDVGQAFAADRDAERLLVVPGEKAADAQQKRDLATQATDALKLPTNQEKIAFLESIKPLLDADVVGKLDTLKDPDKLAFLATLPDDMTARAVQLDEAATKAQQKLDTAVDAGVISVETVNNGE